MPNHFAGLQGEIMCYFCRKKSSLHKIFQKCGQPKKVVVCVKVKKKLPGVMMVEEWLVSNYNFELLGGNFSGV